MLAVDSGTFRIQSERDPVLRFCGCARHCATCWTGESQGTGGEDVVVASDLGTTVLLVARLNKLRAACGTVVAGGMLIENVEDENDDG